MAKAVAGNKSCLYLYLSLHRKKLNILMKNLRNFKDLKLEKRDLLSEEKQNK